MNEIKIVLETLSRENSFEKISEELDMIINDNKEKDKLINDFISSLNEIYMSHEKTCKIFFILSEKFNE